MKVQAPASHIPITRPGVDNTMIMNSYSFQDIILAIAGILMGIAFTGYLPAWEDCFGQHPERYEGLTE